VRGLVPALNKNALDVCADFLTQVHRYIETEALPDALGEAFLAAQSKSYVITVPAIWTDRAKDLTRQAASRAGIPEDKLILVTEPEAAALYSATTGDQLDLQVGDSFIICDAGGGTVVCEILSFCWNQDLIAYEITGQNPFKIKECTIGTGAACGAFQLEEGFKDMLRSKLGKHAQLVLTDQVIEEACASSSFQNKIKTSFNPYENDEDSEEYMVPLKGAPEIPSIGLESGYLELQKSFPALFRCWMIERIASKFSSLCLWKFVVSLRPKFRPSGQGLVRLPK
jgi:Hsp70 protein